MTASGSERAGHRADGDVNDAGRDTVGRDAANAGRDAVGRDVTNAGRDVNTTSRDTNTAGRDNNFINLNLFASDGDQAASAFGADPGDGPARRTTRSGRVHPAELDAIRSTYVARPIDAELRSALIADHLVLLQGRRGSGRRAAALRGLAEVADDRVNVLDASRPKALHNVGFIEGEGYFYDASAIPWNDEDWSESAIGVLQDTVRSAGAHLVVLLPDRTQRPHLPCRLAWTRISDRELLDGAGLDPPLPDGEAVIARLVGKDAPVADVAELFAHLRRRQAEGISLDDAVEEHPGSRRDEIHEWVEGIDDRETAAMVACLCFLGGTSETAFDTGHLDLLDALSADDDADERKAARQRQYAPRGPLLERCCGQQRTQRRIVASLEVDVPVIDLQVSDLAPFYVEELWRSRPDGFRREVVLWLRRFVPTLAGDDLVAAAKRVALLAEADFKMLVAELLHPWADGDPYDSFLAAGVLHTMGDNGRSAEAYRIACLWADQPIGSSRMLTATYAFGMVATEHPERALRVFGKSLRMPTGPTRWAARDGWRALARAATENEPVARAVARHFATHKAVREGRVDQPVFAMLDIWFAEGDKKPPLAVQAAALSTGVERTVAGIITSVLARTHARIDWFRPLVMWLDSRAPATSDLVERLIVESLRRLEPDRREYVVELLLPRLWRWNAQDKGPTPVAVERAENLLRPSTLVSSRSTP